MVKIAVIGSGNWGVNLIRNINDLPVCDLKTVCDLSEKNLKSIKQKYPNVLTTSRLEDLFEDSDIDGVVIATPAMTHYEIAEKSLKSGKHVLVEKPMATNSRHCEKLVELAKEKKKILMVGHTFVYNLAVRKLKELITSGELGGIYYIYSTRVNLGRVKRDVNALWNFMPHDISILLYVLEKKPVAVSARGWCYLQEDIEDVAFLDIEFENKISAHIHVSWLDPSKTRKMTVVGKKKMIIYDDISTDAKIQIFDKGARQSEQTGSFGEFQLLLYSGDVLIPKIKFIEPLSMECTHFIECMKSEAKPLTDGENGLEVVRVLEAAQKSMENNGIRIEL
jgi:predicted dehydrogenase